MSPPKMRYGRLAPDGTVIADTPPIDPDNPTEEELRSLSYPSVLLSFEPGNESDGRRLDGGGPNPRIGE